ncbi:MAG: Crp/Fnr family transcriptional regulator [Ruminococcus sp.]|nr:Crp/Fnr family transcriptional regulator [Ruminococcus sp.]
MKNSILSTSVLFSGFDESEINKLLQSLHACEKRFRKGTMIFTAGDISDNLCFVADGSVTIESNDIWGNRTILNLVGKGQFFAESYALLTDVPMLVDVCANEECSIIFLDMRKIYLLDSESKAKLLNNLLMITARKNLHLSGRSFHTAPRQVRGRVMSYLNSVSIQKKSCEFDIPFDRQQLADYLNVERSVLSNELSRMQKDGLIKCRKNHFIITAEK